MSTSQVWEDRLGHIFDQNGPSNNAEVDNHVLLLGSVRETGGLSQVFPVGELLEHEGGDV